MTELVFMRHGHALSAGEAGVSSDSERPLSPLGEKEALESALHLKTSGFTPDLIISSPFLRADRTAEIAAGVFPSASRQTARALSDGPASSVVKIIDGLSQKGRVMLVGHQPLIGAIAGYLVGSAHFDLPPAGLVRVSRDKDREPGALVELYAPDGKQI